MSVNMCQAAAAAATAAAAAADTGNFMNFAHGVPCLKHLLLGPQAQAASCDFPRCYAGCAQVLGGVATLVA
jgi:hypothetical protein